MLACGRIDTERLRHLLVGCLPPADPLGFAVDVTAWPRCDAEAHPLVACPSTLPALRRSADPRRLAIPVIAQVSFARDSWTAPVDARRLPPWTTPIRPPPGSSARCLLAWLLAGPVPWWVSDAG
jgi:hypothetical protein